MHEKTSILKTIRKIQKYEQRKIIEERWKEEGKKTELNKNRYKKMTREREKEEQSDSAIKMANKILAGDDMN